MHSKESNSTNAARIAALIISILLIVSLALFALVIYLTEGAPATLSKGEILEKLNAAEDKGYTYACSYLTEFGIRNFDKGKLMAVESYFYVCYVRELPSPMELAKATAGYYLNYFYDVIDRSDSNVNTDAVIHCFVKATGDIYARYRNGSETDEYKEESSGAFVGIGVTVQPVLDDNGNIVIISVTEGSPAEAAGILAGDLICAVDGVPTKNIGKDAATSAIKGEIGTSVNLTVIRNGQILELTAVRNQVIEKTVKYRLLESGYGYIQVTGFKEITPSQFKDAIDYMESVGVPGIVFDMRNNRGGQLSAILSMLSYIVPTGTEIVSYVDANGNRYVEAAQDDTAGFDHVLNIPSAVLCNEDTASAAELFTAAMRDYRNYGGTKLLDTVTIGTKTYAKGVMQNQYKIGNDGSTITLTMAFYNPPSNVNYDGEGITPDYLLTSEEANSASLPDYAADILSELMTAAPAA